MVPKDLNNKAERLAPKGPRIFLTSVTLELCLKILLSFSWELTNDSTEHTNKSKITKEYENLIISSLFIIFIE